MQDALCACHARLDIAYLSMEDADLKTASKAALSPEAQPLITPPQAPRQGQSGSAQPSQVPAQSVHSAGAVQTALDQLTGFLECLESMLTLSFPVAVPIPANGILMLLTRILSMDDAARQAGESFTTTTPLNSLGATGSLHWGLTNTGVVVSCCCPKPEPPFEALEVNPVASWAHHSMLVS